MSNMTPEFPMHIEQGADFDHTFQWFGGGKFIAPIEFIEIGYPTIVTVTDHLLNTVSPTPVIISGVDGAPDLNSVETGIEPATRIDANKFSLPVSTVADTWVIGTGELTYFRPTDLTGFTGICKIRKNWFSSTVLHTMSTALGTMTLGAVDGSIRLQITSLDTAAFGFVGGVFDVDLTSGGIITRVFRGPVTLHRDI